METSADRGTSSSASDDRVPARLDSTPSTEENVCFLEVEEDRVIAYCRKFEVMIVRDRRGTEITRFRYMKEQIIVRQRRRGSHSTTPGIDLEFDSQAELDNAVERYYRWVQSLPQPAANNGDNEDGVDDVYVEDGYIDSEDEHSSTS